MSPATLPDAQVVAGRSDLVNHAATNYVAKMNRKNKLKTDIMNFLFGIGAQEMVLIVIALLLLFGGKKLPELMRGAGKGIREFKNAVNDPLKEVVDDVKSTTAAETKSINKSDEVTSDKE